MSEDRPDLSFALDQARAGIPHGFDAIFHATGSAVAGYLRGKRVSDPDALANEVFVRAFRTVHTFEGDGERFRSWLFTIAHNVAIDDWRRRRRRLRETPTTHLPESEGGDVEDDVFARLADERIRGLLEQLTPDQRDVLLLRIVADLSIDETASVLGKGYEAVKALQRRGLTELRRALVDQKGVPR